MYLGCEQEEGDPEGFEGGMCQVCGCQTFHGKRNGGQIQYSRTKVTHQYFFCLQLFCGLTKDLPLNFGQFILNVED